MKSAYEHEQVVQDYLEREERLGRMQRLSLEDVSPLQELGLRISLSGSLLNAAAQVNGV